MKFKLLDDRVVHLEQIWGKYDDDIQFSLTDDDGNIASDADHEYVSNNYASDLYDAWHESKIGQAEDYYDKER